MPDSLGSQVHQVRRMRGLSLKTAAEPAGISPAYLQKLERDEVKKPSPHVLHALAQVLQVPYETLMQLAGYIVPRAQNRGEPASLLAYALSSEELTEEEMEVLARYLRWYRDDKAKNG